jgi:hypothetical protein
MPSQKQNSFQDKIAEEKKRLEEQAVLLPNGPTKDEVLRKIKQLETAPKWTSGYRLDCGRRSKVLATQVLRSPAVTLGASSG